jgi:hypothetical protein
VEKVHRLAAAARSVSLALPALVRPADVGEPSAATSDDQLQCDDGGHCAGGLLKSTAQWQPPPEWLRAADDAVSGWLTSCSVDSDFMTPSPPGAQLQVTAQQLRWWLAQLLPPGTLDDALGLGGAF